MNLIMMDRYEGKGLSKTINDVRVQLGLGGVLLRDTSTLKLGGARGIEPATFQFPDNRSYLLSNCRP